MNLLDLFRSDRPAFIVEEAGREDLQACADIHAAGFRDSWGDGTLAQMIAAPGTTLLVARKKQRVAGFLMYREAAGEAEVLTIATAPNARNTGAGYGLMSEMIRRCLADRLSEIFLEVDSGNVAALALYRKLGFSKVGERKGYYRNAQPGDPADAGNALIMRLDLTD